jgi:hypothetical protein
MTTLDHRDRQALDSIRRVLAMVVVESVRLDKGERMDQEILTYIVQELKRSAALLREDK